MEESSGRSVCSVEECSREKSPKAGKGMCSRHYNAWLRENNPNRCKFEGCEKGVYSRGLCNGHYKQKRAGKALTPLREFPWNRGDDLKTKLEAARDATEPTEKGCWEWKWRTNGGGYGQVDDPEHGNWQTHRASFHVFVRPIKSSEVIHHKCANRSCWNPDHLQATSHVQNLAEMLERRTFKRKILEAELEALEMKEQIMALEVYLLEHALDSHFAEWFSEWQERPEDPAPDLD